MFGRTPEPGVSRSQSLIQEGMVVRGDMRAEGDVRLEGSMEGTLVSKSRVVVGATGVVRADIDAAEVLVMGKVYGKISGIKRIELRKGAHVEGDLTTQAIVIEEGVFFRGHCQMATQPQIAAVPAPAEKRFTVAGEGGRERDTDLLTSSTVKPN